MTEVAIDVRVRLILYVALLATVGLYWAGLRGPFLLDDIPNFTHLFEYVEGRSSAAEVIFGNASGMLGRPVSMASLWFSAATGGMHPFPFKIGNLLIHLLCGLVGWQLLGRLLAEDPRLAQRASLLAAVLAGLWLVHPIHVSTVLYAVQRMAQLSALFVLAAVWVYVMARHQLAAGRTRPAAIKLFVMFPLLLFLGLFSKENAAVAVLLCAVVEFAYFLRQPRPGRALPLFYTLFLLLPLVLVLGALFLGGWERVFGSYAGRDFSLYERLLSQPRALWEYIALMLWPRGGMMGVYVDDFAASTSLFSPLSTVLALVGLLAVSGFAIVVRKVAPSVFAGWFFFLAAHSIESTVIPLELYFEHRNYLPSWGILLMAAGILSLLAAKLPAHWQAGAGRAGYALAASIALGFSLVTWYQVQVWRSEAGIAGQALKHRPNSLRALLARNTVAVHAHDWETSAHLMSRLMSSSNPERRLLGNVYQLTIDCIRGLEGDSAYLHRAEATGGARLSFGIISAYQQLDRALRLRPCGDEVTNYTVANSIEALLENTPLEPESSQKKWNLRSTAAGLYRREGDLEAERAQLELAWQPGVSDTAIGGMLAVNYLNAGDLLAAQRTVDQIRAQIRPYQKAAVDGVAALQAQIDAAREQ